MGPRWDSEKGGRALHTDASSEGVSGCSDHQGLSDTRVLGGPSSVHVFIGHLQETLQNQRLSTHQQGNSCPALKSQATDGLALPSSVPFCPSWPALSRSPWARSTLSKTARHHVTPTTGLQCRTVKGLAQPGPRCAWHPAFSPTPPNARPSVLPNVLLSVDACPSHEATPTGTMLSMGPPGGLSRETWSSPAPGTSTHQIRETRYVSSCWGPGGGQQRVPTPHHLWATPASHYPLAPACLPRFPVK